VAGLQPGGVASGLRPSGTSNGPMGRLALGAPRVPRLTGVDVFERGRPGPRLTIETGGVPMGLASPGYTVGESANEIIHKRGLDKLEFEYS